MKSVYHLGSFREVAIGKRWTDILSGKLWWCSYNGHPIKCLTQYVHRWCNQDCRAFVIYSRRWISSIDVLSKNDVYLLRIRLWVCLNVQNIWQIKIFVILLIEHEVIITLKSREMWRNIRIVSLRRAYASMHAKKNPPNHDNLDQTHRRYEQTDVRIMTFSKLTTSAAGYWHWHYMPHNCIKVN